MLQIQWEGDAGSIQINGTDYFLKNVMGTYHLNISSMTEGFYFSLLLGFCKIKNVSSIKYV